MWKFKAKQHVMILGSNLLKLWIFSLLFCYWLSELYRPVLWFYWSFSTSITWNRSKLMIFPKVESSKYKWTKKKLIPEIQIWVRKYTLHTQSVAFFSWNQFCFSRKTVWKTPGCSSKKQWFSGSAILWIDYEGKCTFHGKNHQTEKQWIQSSNV